MSKNEKTEQNETKQDYRSLADFPGVDSVEIVRDLSHESQCEVLNPHPDLVYRFVRCIEGRSRVPIAIERGWRDNPPGLNKQSGQMEPVRVRGYTPDVQVMGMSRELYETRMGDKAQKAKDRAAKVAKEQMAGAASPGTRVDGGDLRIHIGE